MCALDTDGFDDLLDLALAEDIGEGDVTTLATVPPETQAVGRLVMKEDGVIAGCTVAARVFAAVDETLHVTWFTEDGEHVAAGDEVGRIEGRARAILTAERLALNFIQRMGGIATATYHMVQAAQPARVLDTRKTTPGMRRLDKWAVRLGGGTNHRAGLYDQILIKDNHIEAAGGVRAALEATQAYLTRTGADLRVEIETRTLDEVDAVLAAHADGLPVDVILLDNMARRTSDGPFDTSMLAEAVRRIDGRILTEASGNVTLGTASAIADTGVDALSSGALTHSVRALDISLVIDLVA